jgi:hypothetical protein
VKRALSIAAVLVVSVALPAAVTAQKPPQKPPKQRGNLSLRATPNPVKFGKSVTIAGKLTGPGKAEKAVTLSEDPFAFDAWTQVGTATVDAQGDYSFVRGPTVNTRYQARQGGLESEIVTVSVSPRVSLRLSDRTPAAGKRVRFSGRVCPQHDGVSLALQRRTAPKQWRTVARVVTADAGDECSTYSRRRRVRRDGVYRTFFSADADHAAGSSRPRRIDVH